MKLFIDDIFTIVVIICLVLMLYAMLAGVWGFNPFPSIEYFNMKLFVTSLVVFVVTTIIVHFLD